ncbi:TOBE domain-containing protein [Denitrobaculum tricleocarpae]|uniref:TOBE domain-containing protein n=1 Tax=Denitrobaculum tricleocarpae TaxID=2591009 RepID=A0A545SXR6_9PROT|nr:TOBE domain-containing protein [Denitrobaculum tricleocarpae]
MSIRPSEVFENIEEFVAIDADPERIAEELERTEIGDVDPEGIDCRVEGKVEDTVAIGVPMDGVIALGDEPLVVCYQDAGARPVDRDAARGDRVRLQDVQRLEALHGHGAAVDGCIEGRFVSVDHGSRAHRRRLYDGQRRDKCHRAQKRRAALVVQFRLAPVPEI